MTLIAALAVGGGLALLVVGALLRVRERDEEIASVLQLPFGEQGLPPEDLSRSVLLESGIAAVHAGLEQLKMTERISVTLARGRVPMRPGEFVLLVAGASILGAGFIGLFTGSPALAMLALGVFPWLAWMLVKAKVERRRRAFEAQLPDAFTLVASSLEAGHTFLHSVEMMIEESEAPLSEEFDLVLAETRLGHSLVDALQRMSDRVDITDLGWAVHAIRIQQTVGGKLADLLSTLAEFMRSREEIRREVRVLTAEGRLSGNILGGLPFFMLLTLQVLNPEYIKPLFHGKGLIALIAATISIFIGIGVIRKMAKVNV